MHLGITQWRCLHRVLRKYINNTKSLVKLFFPSVCGCLWVLSSHARHLCFSRLQKNCSFTPSFIYISFCLFQRKCSFMPSFIYFFVYSKKNVVFITSRTRNGRMSITVQYITILSQTVGQCNVIVFTKINRFIQFQAGGQKLQKKTNYLFLFFYVWPKALLYCKQ